jgi:hypothetical protein
MQKAMAASGKSESEINEALKRLQLKKASDMMGNGDFELMRIEKEAKIFSNYIKAQEDVIKNNLQSLDNILKNGSA